MDDFYNFGFEHMFGFGGFFMSAFMIVFWGLVIWGIYTLIKSATHGDRYRDERKEEDRALAILKERYAKGEISKEEFEEKKKNLLT